MRDFVNIWLLVSYFLVLFQTMGFSMCFIFVAVTIYIFHIFFFLFTFSNYALFTASFNVVFSLLWLDRQESMQHTQRRLLSLLLWRTREGGRDPDSAPLWLPLWDEAGPGSADVCRQPRRGSRHHLPSRAVSVRQWEMRAQLISLWQRQRLSG
jgi:hypothetical protein